MEKKKTCEIVQDLMPLYVDGVCMDASREMVETHLKECETCRKQCEEMSIALPQIAVSGNQEKDMKVAKAFRKIRGIVLSIFIIALILVMMIGPVWAYWDRHMPEFGLSAKNQHAYETVQYIMYDWENYGAEAAIGEMEPLQLYKELSTALTTEELNWWVGIYEEEIPVYIPFEIGGERYYMQDWGGGFTWEHPTTELGLEMAEALETGDNTAFWHALWCEYERGFIATEEIYKKVTSRFDTFNPEGFVPFEQGGKNYYWYVGELSEGEVLPTFPDFTADMYEVVEDLYRVDNDFAYIMETMFLPEALYEEYVQTYNQIRTWYDMYATHYEELGYEEFEKQWRKRLMEEFSGTQNGDLKLESYTISEDDGLYQATGDAKTAWRVVCEVVFSDGQKGSFLFYVDNGHCYLFDYNIY